LQRAGAISSLLLLVAIGVATGLATLFGGTLALRFRGQIPLILAFSAGAVIGVALFDLTPEALELGGRIAPPATVLGVIGAGFCGYMILERALRAAAKGSGGHLAPASLTLHSLIDGLGIGLAFQIAPAIGLVVAVAVLAHDIADGINTVTLSLAGGGGTARARAWLVADAAAPLVGIGLTRLFSVGAGPRGRAGPNIAGVLDNIGARAQASARNKAFARGGSRHPTHARKAASWLVVRLATG